MKEIQIEKKEIKVLLLIDDMILYGSYFKNSTGKLMINSSYTFLAKVPGYKINSPNQ